MSGFETILPFLKPIEHLILDISVSEVMVNGPDRVFIERDGFVEQVPGISLGERSLTVAVKNIARRLGDDISESKPILDSRLPDGSRVAAVLPPCSRMLAVLPEPAAIIAAVAAFTGARKGEIRGFLWESYEGFTIEVKQSVLRNQVGEPKREKSKETIPVIAQLKLFLDRHRVLSGNPSQGFIFRNLSGNPLNLDLLVTKVIQPAFEAEKIPWYGWHAFRRGLATNLHRLGVSDKVIQQILRHANVATTINIYVKMVSQDAEKAMKRLESKCSLVVPQTVPQLQLESPKLGNESEVETARKPLTLEPVIEILAERGGEYPLLLRGRRGLVRVGMSLCFNAHFRFEEIASAFAAPNPSQIAQK
jgi:hypothetical protein